MSYFLRMERSETSPMLFIWILISMNAVDDFESSTDEGTFLWHHGSSPIWVRWATTQLTPAHSVQLTPPPPFCFWCEFLPGVKIGEESNSHPIILHQFVIRMNQSMTYPKCSWRQMDTHLASEISLLTWKRLNSRHFYLYVKTHQVAYVKVAVIPVLNDRWHQLLAHIFE